MYGRSSVDGLAAALDLGSNSFHLIIARVDRGELVALERLKEKVQLGRGSTNGAMSAAAVQRGLDCVARFAQRLRSIPLDRISIVGTAALREAVNRDSFLEPAQRLLRHPIRVLTGEEEAELIFLGVSHALAANDSRRLVIDIGGGSTEFCVGGSFDPQHSTSVDLGCVTLTDRCLNGDVSLATGYAEARRDARALLAPIVAAWKSRARDAIVIGTSGTIESVRSVLVANGFAFVMSGMLTVFLYARLWRRAGVMTDVQFAESRLMNAVEAVYEPYRERVEQQHAAFQRLVDLPVPPPKPVGRLRFTSEGLEFLVRYPAEMKQATTTDDRVVSALREAIEHEPRLSLAGSGAPKLQSTV